MSGPNDLPSGLSDTLFQEAWREKKYILPDTDTRERDIAKMFWDRAWTMSRRAYGIDAFADGDINNPPV